MLLQFIREIFKKIDIEMCKVKQKMKCGLPKVTKHIDNDPSFRICNVTTTQHVTESLSSSFKYWKPANCSCRLFKTYIKDFHG